MSGFADGSPVTQEPLWNIESHERYRKDLPRPAETALPCCHPSIGPRGMSALRRIRFWLPSLLALSAWGVWGVLHGGFGNASEFWGLSVAMVFGSLIAGTTPLGGGVVAFPFSSLAYDLPAVVGRDFSLLIQSVGMGVASITILMRRLDLPWAMLRVAIPTAVASALVSFFLLAPHIPGLFVKVLFAAITLTAALVLLDQSRQGPRAARGQGGNTLAVMMLSTVGGLIAGFTGTGTDFFVFIAFVALARVDERFATAASVLVMAAVSISLTAGLFLGPAPIHPVSLDMWRACIPVVVFGAPLGAALCLRLPRTYFLNLLLVVALAQFVAHLWFLESARLWLVTTLIAFLGIYALIQGKGSTRAHLEKVP